MALRIYQNVFALNSQRNLGVTQTDLGKSIERLSSGLRINHAADDASGLAISEKLRGQIKGLKRATMNAQDGISMLQIAEGALGEVSSMLQRMRELAVQAANGTYTSSDRAELQKEVDQLKDEIDRISNATEFNTKKLLNGSGTALWSADTSRVKAIVRGDVQEGNYEINMSVTAGRNQVMKSDIMTLKEDAIGAEITTAGGSNPTNITLVTDPNSVTTTGTSYFTVTVGNGTEANLDSAAATVVGTYQQNGGSWAVSGLSVTSASASGYVEIEFTETTSSVGSMGGTNFRYRFISAVDGTISRWQTASTTATGLDISNATLSLEMSANVSLGVSGSVIAGDKLLFAVTPAANSAISSLTASGGGTIQISGGPSNIAGPTIIFTSADSLTIADDGDSSLDYHGVKIYVASLSENGNVDVGNLTFNFRENTQVSGSASAGLTLSGSFTLAIQGGGEAATASSKLRDLGNFTDSDGNEIFENKQELTIFGNGKQTKIYLEGDDTLADVEAKLTEAIVNDLEMGSDDTTVNSHLVDYISSAEDGGQRAVRGTFVIQTALTGEQGELAFIGNQQLLDALALAQIQSAQANTTEVTIRDAHTGDLIGSDTTGDDRIYGLIDGLELVFDSRAAVKASWSAGSTSTMVFSEDPAIQTSKYHLHVVDNSTELQIGPNNGQKFSVSIPQLDSVGLGLENVLLVSQKHAQRAITDIDAAISMAVTTRATIGAQISRLEHTIINLDTARENMSASESRIRDLDIAEEMSVFTRNQILSQAGTSMLAQANQIPQMALSLLQG